VNRFADCPSPFEQILPFNLVNQFQGRYATKRASRQCAADFFFSGASMISALPVTASSQRFGHHG
jgi:hypothetical protein